MSIYPVWQYKEHDLHLLILLSVTSKYKETIKTKYTKFSIYERQHSDNSA